MASSNGSIANNEKRLRLEPEDRAVLLRALACYLDILPSTKGRRWVEPNYSQAYEHRRAVSLAYAMTSIRPKGGRRERHTWRLEDTITPKWCLEQAEKLEPERHLEIMKLVDVRYRSGAAASPSKHSESLGT